MSAEPSTTRRGIQLLIETLDDLRSMLSNSTTIRAETRSNLLQVFQFLELRVPLQLETHPVIPPTGPRTRRIIVRAVEILIEFMTRKAADSERDGHLDTAQLFSSCRDALGALREDLRVEEEQLQMAQ